MPCSKNLQFKSSFDIFQLLQYLSPRMIEQQEIVLVLKKIHSGIAVDTNHLNDCFGRFLQINQPHLIAFMNNQFFRDEFNLIAYIKESIDEGLKMTEQTRKIIYEFIAEYIVAFKDNLNDYLKGLFDNFFVFFKLQKSFRTKEKSLQPIKEILLNYESEDLMKQVLKPDQFHKTLVTILKIEKVLPSVRGQIWLILGIIQNKFASQIPFAKKKQVQQISLTQLKSYVSSDKNISTIAAILRAFSYSLSENYLDQPHLKQLFMYCKAIMIPVKSTFDAPIAALELLISQASLFHNYILQCASDIFKQLAGLMGHHNKNFKFAVLDALCAVIRQIVIGISSNLEDENMINLFHYIGKQVWMMLEKQTSYDPNATQDDKNRFTGSIISIVKILGIMSPLILAINGKEDLKRFFSRLLTICNRKVIRAFEDVNGSFAVNKKIYMMKVVLYHQKELISFISSFAKIIEQLDSLDESDAIRLEQLFLVAVRQYPHYLQKYKPSLIQSMVIFLMGLSTKPQIFNKWIKKLILMGLMECLDAKQHNINNDNDYYRMISKASTLWKDLLTHPGWHNIVLVEFARVFFQSIEHLFLNLDVSYKTNLELEIEEEQKEQLKDINQNIELANVFFLSDETILMCNVTDYQYISGLVLVYNELMNNVDRTLYFNRIFAFYEQIMYRIKIFPKSIPLMKIVRSLNNFLIRTDWFEKQEEQNSRNSKQLLSSLVNFYKFTCSNIFKYQQNYFYEALKMLLSMPYQVYMAEQCYLLKNNLPVIIQKSLQLGQQILSLAQETINCISILFNKAKQLSVKYLSECIPELQKFINMSKNSDGDGFFSNKNQAIESQEKQEVRSYLFLKELKIRRNQISENVMKFLGTVGGIAHNMVENKTKDYISWDYHCKLDIEIVMGGDKYNLNLTKLLSRTCWLMHSGTQTQKIVASEFMHAVIVYSIGKTAIGERAMNVDNLSKINLSNFFDKVLPTILNTASNTSHPSQQLIHTLLIQTVHFLANTQDPNSPDIQTLLRHLISLYTGAQDTSFLASKCLSELVKWHIKQAPAIQGYSFPIVKTVVRNVWSLISNKKARNGLIQFLIKFLKVIHRQQKLMAIYSLQFCSLIISLSRTDRPVQPSLEYLIKKYVLAINPYIKFLIIEQGNRKYRKISTIQKLLQWIYNNALFSIHKQQRTVAFMLWESLLGKYGNSINVNMEANSPINNLKVFFSENCNRQQRYLFAQNKLIVINEQEPKLDKVLPKITSYGEMWIRINEKKIFETHKITTFRDFSQIYLQSFAGFVEYFAYVFMDIPHSERIINDSVQRHIVNCLLIFVEASLSLKQVINNMLQIIKKKVPIYQKRMGKNLSFCEIYFKLLFRPNSLIPNFNYDIIQEYNDYAVSASIVEASQSKLFSLAFPNSIVDFLRLILGNSFIPELISYLKGELRIKNDLGDIIWFLFHESKFYDREIKCILASLAIIANKCLDNRQVFEPIIKAALEMTVKQHQQDVQIAEIPEKKNLSNEKKSLLIWFIFQFPENFKIVQNFLVRLIEHDTAIYQKYEKNVMKAIIENWLSIGIKIVQLIKVNKDFLKVIFILCKALNRQKLEYLFTLIQETLPSSNLLSNEMSELIKDKKSDKHKSIAISESLKINFYLVQFHHKLTDINYKYMVFLEQLIIQSMNVSFSADLHQQALNLAALLILKSAQEENQHLKADFISRFRSSLKSLIIYYIPTQISQLNSQDQKSKCLTFLKFFKSVLTLSKNINLIDFLFSTLKDSSMPEFYDTIIKQIIEATLQACIKNQKPENQYKNINYLLQIFWNQDIDQDCWHNIRVILAQQVLKKALKMADLNTLAKIFQQEAEKLLRILKTPLNGQSAQQIIKNLQIKRAGFLIIEQLYSNMPRNQKGTEQIHSKQFHKPIIKCCVQVVKSKPNEQIYSVLAQYDRKIQEQIKNQIILSQAQKKQLKKKTCIEYLREYCCSAYNCLIVVFISTQSNKNHFTTFIFQPKNHLWDNINNKEQVAFDFQIETNFEQMRPIKPINKALRKNIKDKYWTNSLYVIEEEYVPTSLVENLPIINEASQNGDENRQQLQNQEAPQVLELDTINRHPCMVNLLRVVDHLHLKFYDGTQPGWMKPLYQQLNSDMCSLSTRILLTKLILNRPNIFTQGIWTQILLKYLVLPENGSKFIHYFFRDTLRQFIIYTKNGYKVQSAKDLCVVIMKVIKALPHQNKMIYGDNVDILQCLLSLDGVFVEKSMIMKMLTASEKDKDKSQKQSGPKLKFEWRMCAMIVIKSCLVFKVPILHDHSQMVKAGNNKNLKYKFFYDLRSYKIIYLALQMINQNVKKYRITAAGFLGELLQFVFQNCQEKIEYDSLLQESIQFLKKIAESQSNRTSKQKFSVCIYNITLKHPYILENIQLFNTVQSCLTQYQKQERQQILQTLLVYIDHLIVNEKLSNIPYLLVTIRKYAVRMLTDSQEVQAALMLLLLKCCRHKILLQKQVIETFYYIFQELEDVYSKSIIEDVCKKYYEMLIKLKDFVDDPDLPKTDQIRKLSKMIKKGMVKGLGTRFETVRQLIFQEFERNCQNYDDPAERMIEIFIKVYDKDYEDLWLINVVPLVFSIVKKSSDYDRLRFQQNLGNLTAFYDWDFRKNMKLYNSSQPYTPAFTLATGANNARRNDGSFQPSALGSIGGEKLRGMLRASQNSYMSQEQQVFTILASQSDENASLPSSYNNSEISFGSQMQKSLEVDQEGKNEVVNKIKQMFGSSRRRRNKIIQQFKSSQQGNMASPVKVVNNKLRFNKSFDRSSGSQKRIINEQRPKKEQKGVLIRKYKIGELPDIQITTKDLLEPMLYLANHDHQFASELFVLVFMKIMVDARKQKKQKFKNIICELLSKSQKFEYNFISSLQKSLICLCQSGRQKINFSMKEVAEKSNTFDYAIVYTEENQIQTLKHPDLMHQQNWRKKVKENWGDLIDLYHHISEDDLIYGVLLKLAQGDEKQLLIEALQLKKIGKIGESQKTLNRAMQQSESERIKQFIIRQKVDCQILLGQWDSVSIGMSEKMNNSPLSVDEQKIFSIALQNTKNDNKEQLYRKLNFHSSKCEYQKAILSLLCTNDIDKAKYHSTSALRYFSAQWKKISSFAFSSKHNLLEQIQKIHELQQFLQLYQKYEINTEEYIETFDKWAQRDPNTIYDSNMTWIQLLQSRIMYGNMLKTKFNIENAQLAKSTLSWLIQVSNGMIEKGALGGAQPLYRRALNCRKQYPKFVWQFYQSIGKLKLKQNNCEVKLVDYDVVPRLVQKQLQKDDNVTQLQKLKFVSLQNDFTEGSLQKCLQIYDKQFQQDFVSKVQIVYRNYESIKKSLRSNQLPDCKSDEVLEFKRQMYFKFTMFLQKMLSFVKGRFQIPEIKNAMINKDYIPERLSHVFVETLFTGIQISDFSSNAMIPKKNQKTIFSLIMKLIKVIQMYPNQIGEYFTEAICNKKIPVWIFLNFIPQIIKFINNGDLSPYFEDLFKNIVSKYPEAIIYSFNCYYEKQKQCETSIAKQLRQQLHKKMQINFKFIESLVLLQYPQIRLRECLNQLSIAGEKQNALDNLQKLIYTEESMMGKYNLKFCRDWKNKIEKLINKIESKDLSYQGDINLILQNIDPSRKQNFKTVAASMKTFVKVSDGSTFFEQYNSNDWNRIEVPGTSYRSLQQPKPWQKVYIDSFDHSLLTLQSKQRPRRITVYGSNQKKYMLLVKAGQDVRLDQRIQELFDIMNRIMKDYSECSKKQLQIFRFQVIPIRKMMGLFQWIDQSQTLRQFLEIELKQIKQTEKVNLRDLNGGYQIRMEFMNTIAPLTSQVNDANYQHKAMLTAKPQNIVKCFIECENKIPYGLLRRALQRLSKNYDSFLHIKNSFLANYAVVCVVTYILGIGDRHLQNFLIHMSSASIVPIDFGFCFGASVDLAVPQLMPFRLTKSFSQLADPIGFDGIFKKSMINSFDAFSDNIPIISDYCEVFVDDPLLQWIWNHKRTNPQSYSSFSKSQEPFEKALFNKKIDKVRRKLQRQNPRIIMEQMIIDSPHKHRSHANILIDTVWGNSKNKEKKLRTYDVVDQLISMATNKNILGRTYVGWNPYI